jgi:putative colanic acid biosynthesis UDP-glucose lipid carrier transferase
MSKASGRYSILITLLYLLEDILLLNILFFLLMYFFDIPFSDDTYHLALVIFNLGYLLSFAIIRVDFSDVRELHAPNLIRRNFMKLVFTAFVLISSLFFLKMSTVLSRVFILTFFCSAFPVMVLSHWVTRKLLTFTIRSNINKGIILGAGRIGERFFNELLDNIYNGVVILGFFDDDSNRNSGDILGSVEDAKDYILQNGVTQIFCTLPLSAEEKIVDMIKFSESHVINFHIVPEMGYYYSGDQALVTQIGRMPVFALRRIPLSYTHNALIKRGFDIIVSSILLIILSPVIFPVLAVLVKLSSPGPVFFKQQRTGAKGKVFTCYKFRTMRCSDDAHTRQASLNDERKTRIGNFLRKTSLDELPQLFNVLIGNMSLVGPRPHMLQHTYEYSPKVDKYMVRHFVKPGITGWAQVKGYRGETKEIELMEKRIKQDILYVENWSIWLDIAIIVKTAFMLMKGDDKAF